MNTGSGMDEVEGQAMREYPASGGLRYPKEIQQYGGRTGWIWQHGLSVIQAEYQWDYKLILQLYNLSNYNQIYSVIDKYDHHKAAEELARLCDTIHIPT